MHTHLVNRLSPHDWRLKCPGSAAYLDELLVPIREPRTPEKRSHQKVHEIFARTSADYAGASKAANPSGSFRVDREFGGLVTCADPAASTSSRPPGRSPHASDRTMNWGCSGPGFSRAGRRAFANPHRRAPSVPQPYASGGSACRDRRLAPRTRVDQGLPQPRPTPLGTRLDLTRRVREPRPLASPNRLTACSGEPGAHQTVQEAGPRSER